MKTVVSLILACAFASAVHAAAQYSSNSPSQPVTPAPNSVGHSQRLDVGRLTLLPGPTLTAVHPGLFQTAPIPALNSSDSPAFLYKYTDPAFETTTTKDNIRRTRLRITPPESAKEFSAPVSPARPTSLHFDQRLPAPPSVQTPRAQPASGAITPPPATTP
ncbi:MAG TPA: hypothetical protein VGE76_10960 [Opitutaceae bacterium]